VLVAHLILQVLVVDARDTLAICVFLVARQC
jgi:hypothetical protein